MPMLDYNLATPLFKTIYLGHPSCEQFRGEDLAKVVLDLLAAYDLHAANVVAGFTGGCHDGQYNKLSVMEHIGWLQLRSLIMLSTCF
jgi:hypothetical protein